MTISLPRDANRVTVIGGTSSTDGVTPVSIYVDPTTHRIKADVTGIIPVAGSDTWVQYNRGGVLGADSNLAFDYTNKILKVGGGTPTYTVGTNNIFNTTKSYAGYLAVNLQNLSNGTASSTDFIINADNATDTTNWLDIGIASSLNTDPLYTIAGANQAYIYNQSESLAIGTATTGKVIKFFTGGTLAANEGARLDAGTFSVGLNATTLGKLKLYGNTSGSVTIQPNAVAGTGIVLTAPATTGTIALTSDLSSYVPYTGATTDLNLATHNLIGSNLIEGYTSTATAAGTTTLTVSSTEIQNFTGVANQTLVLPNATTLTKGHSFRILNTSTGNITVQTNGGATIWTMAATTDLYLICTDNSTAAGTWEIHYIATGISTGKRITVANSLSFIGADAQIINFGTNNITLTTSGATSLTLPSSGTVATGTGSVNEIAYWSGTNTLGSLTVATYPSLTELSYVKGVTSSIQTQLNAKGVGDMVLASIQTVTGAKTFNDGKLILAGATSGTLTLKATAVAGTNTITFPASTGTVALTSDIPVKATGAELDTGTDDAKFATAKALKDSHNVPSVAPGTSGNVLTSNGTDWVSSAPAGGGTITSTALEALSAGDFVSISFTPNSAGSQGTTWFGTSTLYNQKTAFNVVGNGVSFSSMNLNLAKVGSPTDNITIRIETDSAGLPSGTLANANATATVAGTGLTTSLVDTTVTFAGAFTLTAGTMYWVVLNRDGALSDTNYYVSSNNNQDFLFSFTRMQNYASATWTQQNRIPYYAGAGFQITGVNKCRSSLFGLNMMGFVVSNASAGASVSIYGQGSIATNLSSLIPGMVYKSNGATTPGSIAVQSGPGTTTDTILVAITSTTGYIQFRTA